MYVLIDRYKSSKRDTNDEVGSDYLDSSKVEMVVVVEWNVVDAADCCSGSPMVMRIDERDMWEKRRRWTLYMPDGSKDHRWREATLSVLTYSA